MSNIRSEMIDAKINGNLHNYTIEKLSGYIKNFQDFSSAIDILEDFEKQALTFYKTPQQAPGKLKQALKYIGSAVLGGTVGSMGITYANQRRKHSQILEQLKKDSKYSDKKKVQEIYGMVSQFAPKASTNLTFVKSIMDQLYDAPMITAPMVKEIVQVEKEVRSPFPSTKELMTAGTAALKIGI